MRLGHRDLHVVDVAAVPDRLEDPVAEPEDEQVLDGLLAQVVVDAEDLRSRKTLPTSRLRRIAESRSCPNGFSMTTRRQPPSWVSWSSPTRPSWPTMIGNADSWVAR